MSGDTVRPVPAPSDPRKEKAGAPTQIVSHLQTHVTYPNVYMVAVGDMLEGFTFYGPFSDVSVAMRWAVDNLKVGEVIKVYPMSHVRGVRGEVEATA